MTVDRILLVGLMGSGKSTVGRLVAGELGWPYLDNDELVGRAMGAMLEELRIQSGGDALHDAESAALREVLAAPAPVVASTAASVVDKATDRALLMHSDALVVWLRIASDALARRLTGDETRPWLADDPEAVLTRMARERDPFYEQVSDLALDATETPAYLARAVMRHVS